MFWSSYIQFKSTIFLFLVLVFSTQLLHFNVSRGQQFLHSRYNVLTKNEEKHYLLEITLDQWKRQRAKSNCEIFYPWQIKCFEHNSFVALATLSRFYKYRSANKSSCQRRRSGRSILPAGFGRVCEILLRWDGYPCKDPGGHETRPDAGYPES